MTQTKEQYEAMAHEWNQLPGSKLTRDKDAWGIRYCSCPIVKQEHIRNWNGKPLHDMCGFFIEKP